VSQKNRIRRRPIERFVEWSRVAPKVRDNCSLFSAAQEVFDSGDQASSNTLLLYAGIDNKLTQVGTETQIMGAQIKPTICDSTSHTKARPFADSRAALTVWSDHRGCQNPAPSALSIELPARPK
jgi:hypothetical protein